MPSPDVLLTFASSLFAGSIVALVNHLFTRRKAKAEAREVELRNERAEVEIESFRRETKLRNKKLDLEIEALHSEDAKSKAKIRELEYEVQEMKTTVLDVIKIAPNKSIKITEERHVINL